MPAAPLVFVLNGPNLNMLGARQPELYGSLSLSEIERLCEQQARKLDLALEFRQTNREGELVDWIQEARTRAEAIVINAAAYTHTSVAVLDALLAFAKPVVEVHLSNIFRREPFRHHSYVSPAATGVICGFGPMSYVLALDAIAAHLAAQKTRQHA